MRYPSANRSSPLRRRSSSRLGLTALTPALLLVLVLVLEGCSSAPQAPESEVPASAPDPVEVELDPPKPASPPPESPPAPIKPACAWFHTKGLAEVVGLEDADAEFRFYPGDIRVPVPAGKRYERGREFKAILMQAQGCQTRLQLVDVVP